MSLAALKERLSEVHHLNQANALLGWDQQTYMPPEGSRARSNQMATLSKLAHEMLTSEAMGRLIEDAEIQVRGMDYDSNDASLVRVARRDYEKAVRIPSEHVAELRRTTGMAREHWVAARAESDFSKFQDMLSKIFELTAKSADYLGYEDTPYDALVDMYEPGITTAEIHRLFTELREGLVPLVEAIAENQDAVDDTVLHQYYPIDKQREFGEMVIKKFGYSFQSGRQDLAVHPFCSNFSCNDVRITTRFNEDWLSPALFGTMHESGHGLYEQGSPQALDDTILAGGTSLGVHESQSRMWENVIGRSRPFWQHFYPDLQKLFPDVLGIVDVETFYKAINTSQPSFIRVEADEVTYNLHIMLRFDLETAVYDGKLAVKDLPEAWNAKMEEYLGVVPPNDAEGVLQDIHWSMGIMGYFPTYALGNLLSLQFYNEALKAHPEIPDETAQGKFDTLLNWMRQNIHVHARKYEPAELVKRVTGTVMQTGPLLDYLNAKFSDVYGL